MSGRSRIAAEHANHGAQLAKALERTLYRRVVDVPFEISKERILPELPPERARLDACQIEPLFVEDFEHAPQRPALVRCGKYESRLVVARRRRRLPANEHEAR